MVAHCKAYTRCTPLDDVTGFGVVYLVRKRNGTDAGTLYAMKVIEKARVTENRRTRAYTMLERRIFEDIGDDAPFLVKLHYAFQTESSLNFVIGKCLKLLHAL
jgi:hypothetical protein